MKRMKEEEEEEMERREGARDSRKEGWKKGV